MFAKSLLHTIYEVETCLRGAEAQLLAFVAGYATTAKWARQRKGAARDMSFAASNSCCLHGRDVIGFNEV